MIYFVAQVGQVKRWHKDSKTGEFKKVEYTDSRCIGYYTDLKKAKRRVKANIGSLNEAGYYPWVVIEGVKNGIYRYFGRTDYWYEFNKKTNKFDECEKPKKFKHLVGFTIG